MTPEWWNSLHKLSVLNIYLLLGAGLSAVFAALFALALWKVGAQITFLQEKESQESEQRIADANNNAQQAILGQKLLEAKTEEARLAQEKLRQENLQLATKYEEERTARLNLEARLAPRRISSEQHRALVARLQQFRGSEIGIYPAVSEGEVADLVTDLVRVFQDSGFSVSTAASAPTFAPRHGLTLVAGKGRLALANEIGIALMRTAVINAPIPTSVNEGNSNELSIMVGPK